MTGAAETSSSKARLTTKEKGKGKRKRKRPATISQADAGNGDNEDDVVDTTRRQFTRSTRQNKEDGQQTIDVSHSRDHKAQGRWLFPELYARSTTRTCHRSSTTSSTRLPRPRTRGNPKSTRFVCPRSYTYRNPNTKPERSRLRYRGRRVGGSAPRERIGDRSNND